MKYLKRAAAVACGAALCVQATAEQQEFFIENIYDETGEMPRMRAGE